MRKFNLFFFTIIPLFILFTTACASSGIRRFTQNGVEMTLERYPKSGPGPLHVVFRVTVKVPEHVYEKTNGCLVCIFRFEDYEQRSETGCPPDPQPEKEGTSYMYEFIESHTFRAKGTYIVSIDIRELESGQKLVIGSIPVTVFSNQVIPTELGD